MDLPQLKRSLPASEQKEKRLLLEKFSYATTALQGPHPWVHDNRREELCQVFQTARVPNGSNGHENHLIMSVVAAQEILECVDLSSIAGRLHGAGLPPPVKGEAALINVVVKCPCIAIRYILSPTMARRMQMRYRTEEDYQTVLQILQILKFPIQVSSAPDIHPPGSTQSVSSNYLHQQNTTQSHPPESKATAVAKNLGDTAGGLSFINMSSPSAAASTLRRPPTASSQTMGSEKTRSSTPYSVKPNTGSDDQVFQRPLRPASAIEPGKRVSSIYISQLSQEMNTTHTPREAANVVSDLATNSPYFSQSFNPSNIRPNSAQRSLSHIHPTFKTQTFGSQPFNAVDFRHLRSMTLDRDSPEAEPTALIASSGRVSMPFQYMRPMSSPVDSDVQISSSLLPPRRDLPFPKTRGPNKSRAIENFTALKTPTKSSSVEIIQPTGKSPESEIQSTPIKSPKKLVKRVAKRPAKTLVSDKKTVDAQDSITISREESVIEIVRGVPDNQSEESPLAAKSAALARPSTAPGLSTKAVTNRKRKLEAMEDKAKQAKKMVDKATQTQTLSGRDHTSGIPSAKRKEGSRSPNLETQSPLPENLLDGIDSFVSKYKHRPPPQEVHQGNAWKEASEEERHQSINDFICDNLENEEFIQLCEDTHNVWRRIGLEM